MAGYDRKAGTDFEAEVSRLRLLGLETDDTLVDLGCGTGGLAAAVAPHCARVVAVDVSPAMLEAAARKMSAFPNVELVLAGLLTYEHEGEAPAFVYSRNAFHHLPGFWKALALERVARMLRPGGRFLLEDFFFSFEPDEAEERISAWLDRAPEDPRQGWTREQLQTHLRGEHSTFTWLLEPMIQRAGLQILEAEYSDSKVYAAYVLSSRP